jgi:tRNA threonylcarbamoyladenosine biosynthesis protein TsaE
LALGEKIGRNLRGGEVIELSSDLGGGKTTLVKGIAKGLGSLDVVTSPSFMIEKVYNCRDGLKLHHFDFYRLNEGGLVAEELAEFTHDPKAIVVVEWGGVVEGTLPENRAKVRINKTEDGGRLFEIDMPHGYEYMAEDVA